MSLAPLPKRALDRTPCTTTNEMTDDQSCNATEESEKDGYEPLHAFKKIRSSGASGLRKSPNKWTKEENQKLAALVHHYGEKKWKRISAEMGGLKTGAQCAQHWKRVLSPEIRKGHWDELEEDLLLNLVVQYGSCWKKIAKKIPQRTDIQCRYQYLKAKQSRTVLWEPKEDESLVKKVLEMASYAGAGGPLPTNGKSHPTPPYSHSSPPPCTCDPMSPCAAPVNYPNNTSPTPMPHHHPHHSHPHYHQQHTNNNPGSNINDGTNNNKLYRHNYNDNNDNIILCGGEGGGPPFYRSPGHFRANSQLREEEDEDKENRGNLLRGKSVHTENNTGSTRAEDGGMLRCSSSGDSSGSEGAGSGGSSDYEALYPPGGSNGNGNGDRNPPSSETDRDRGEDSARGSVPWCGNTAYQQQRGSGPAPASSGPSSSSTPSSSSSSLLSSALFLNKVVWLEVAEHMARLKLTSTLRTALECKTRFLELHGNAIHTLDHESSSNFYNGLKSTGSFPPPPSTSTPMPTSNDRGTFCNMPTDTNINININNDRNNNNITITNNFSHNITINITNNTPHPPTFDAKNPTGGDANTVRPHDSRNNTANTNNNTLPPFQHGFKGMLPVKPEHATFHSNPPTTDSTKKSGLTLPSFPSFPSFPAFPPFPPPVAQPMHAPAKPARQMAPLPLPLPLTMLSSGLDSLAAVASTLPRELLPPLDHPLGS